MKRKLRMGMFGGGNGAFIGAIHRCAALMDNSIELVCGCFSSKPEVSKQSGEELFLPADRVYTSFQEMIEKEKALPDGVRMDFLSIVTPNHLHFEPARLALENGFDVVLDKPMTYSLEEAKELKRIVETTGRTFALTHTYSGYPAVKEAKFRIQRGDFGKIRKIYTEYPQGWLSTRAELDPKSNAGWRTDPTRSGKAGCMGDIGTHALHLAEYVSGLQCTAICADLKTFVTGRLLDDDGAALLRFNNEATGVLMASQVAAGEENALKLRIYGEKGGIEWNQQEPNTLIVKWIDKPVEIIRTGNGYMSDIAKANTRTPGGHPEGYIEAFANIYRNFARTVMARKEGNAPQPAWLDFPNVDDGVRGMQFIETITTSGYNDETKWIEWIK
ncbi:Gfo/Idh/MocA family oxidoreductase [Bacteroides sp. OttesenSCG-928-J23]|nr:Gfo/Idh/MocA family oxidoreductase [Bacteroides sp. OttesenSCG-928-J23]MDL2299825.1 Gfo/Idh/MocA family oxidoreductase [Bacteroides sp. OttesenSCG-928-E20]MDL2305136.1 Gfo/Idh/MocA family oxidoreductase [Bacteroides sp. OttesenSCG-928-D19]